MVVHDYRYFELPLVTLCPVDRWKRKGVRSRFWTLVRFLELFWVVQAVEVPTQIESSGG